MKKIKFYGLIMIIMTIMISCKKDSNNNNSGTATLNFINATLDVSSVSLNFSSTPIPYYLNQTSISNFSSLEFGLPAGQNTINLISSSDTSKTLFYGTFDLGSGDIYSLYLMGQTPQIDTLLLRDQIPVYQDSTAGVRFINLSPDSPSLSVNLQGNNQNEFSTLGYKQISSFKKYPVTSDVINNGGYTYEIKDTSGTVLTVITWNPVVFKNYTMVISGSNSVGNVTVFQINNY